CQTPNDLLVLDSNQPIPDCTETSAAIEDNHEITLSENNNGQILNNLLLLDSNQPKPKCTLASAVIKDNHDIALAENNSSQNSNNILVLDSNQPKPDFTVASALIKDNHEITVAENSKGEMETKQPQCKLLNTLDFLSDDEAEDKDQSKETPHMDTAANDKNFINIEEDDDVMLIDDEPSVKKVEKVTDSAAVLKATENTDVDKILEDKNNLKSDISTSTDIATDTNENNEDASKATQETDAKTKRPPSPKELLPVTFLSTCKKNIAEMTRNDLEEFCILKIVESVIGRSNLGEIKSELKNVSHKVEEYKQKVSTLSKQNVDLQVVLKSIQEELKKKATPITPLKITRSVGMQVLMTDGLKAKRNTGVKQVKGSNANRRSPKHVNTAPQQQPQQQQIPVPRLVPASNNLMKVNPSLQQQISVAKPNMTPPLQNGVKNVSSSGQKAEKRPLSKPHGNSVTVDLTDDEPPLKLAPRMNMNQTVRVVPPQNLMPPQRHQFATVINSPRKVYIPISGVQAQNVRPVQTLMLKTIPNQNVRPRNVTPGSAKQTRRSHPAPLPDGVKQYQPPNWKALPPAPQLKLSKVDNGIVISWKIDGYQEDFHEEIASYQLYAYQETQAPASTNLWKKIGDVKALPLPMACTLTQFMAGFKYYFAVRSVDVRSRVGPFSVPGHIMLVDKDD
ncbi:unnamed protein product, partial [Leptidea sinapis]